jgi:cation diffusion facilitator family transporter
MCFAFPFLFTVLGLVGGAPAEDSPRGADRCRIPSVLQAASYRLGAAKKKRPVAERLHQIPRIWIFQPISLLRCWTRHRCGAQWSHTAKRLKTTALVRARQTTMAAYGSTNLSVETRSPPRDQQKRPSITTHSPGATTIVYDEEAAPPPSPTDQAEARVMRRSLEANVVLTVAKVAVAFQSGSLAVLASLIDSALDLISQIVLFAASARRKDRDVEYPAGRARLEPVGVVVCAMLMGVGSVYVIITSTEQLTDIVKGKNVHVALDRINGTIMVLAIVWKALLYAWISRRHSALSSSNPGVAAVALDHFNDVLSNLVAVIAAVLAAWYGLDAADPAGAIAISLYIAYSWLETSIEQVQHLVGRTADPEFLEELRTAASTYSERMQCDIVRAYHFGPRYLVELEMVMESSTPLRVSHDLALDLQQKIEAFDDVERCFVHVDYDFRDVDEHDPASWSPKINVDRKVPNLV